MQPHTHCKRSLCEPGVVCVCVCVCVCASIVHENSLQESAQLLNG